MSSGLAEIRIRRRIEWVDTDAAGIHHWTTAFRLVEAAETALFDSFGLAERVYGVLPRAHVTVDYHAPLRFNEQVEVLLRVAAVGRTSLRYDFELTRGTDLVADGRLVVVHLDRDSGRPAPLPADVRRALTVPGRRAGDGPPPVAARA